MRVYRYEREDGGGPFCTFDGQIREYPNELLMSDEYLSGCQSLDQLQEYFKGQEDILKECRLVYYDIPFEEIKVPNHREILFPKRYSPHFSF